MLPDSRWVYLDLELGYGELMRGTGEVGRASLWAFIGQGLERNGVGEYSTFRFGFDHCTTMCTFYATCQTLRRQTLGICLRSTTPIKELDHGGIPFWSGIFRWRT